MFGKRARSNGGGGQIQIWEAYSRWVELREIVAAFLAAKHRADQGDNEALDRRVYAMCALYSRTVP